MKLRDEVAAGSGIDKEKTSFILDHRTTQPWPALRDLVPACRLRIVNLYPYHTILIVGASVHSPCLNKKLASTSPANACFIAVGFLGKSWACMIVAGDCERSNEMKSAIGRNLLAKSGSRMLLNAAKKAG